MASRSIVSSGITGDDMTTRHPSLRFEIEKLVGTTRCGSMQVRLVKHSRLGGTRRVCVRIEWASGAISLFFFRHADGRWRLFPPEQPRPAMGAGLKAA
jgi:hypothetical protein